MMGGVEGQGELGRKDTTLSSVLRTTAVAIATAVEQLQWSIARVPSISHRHSIERIYVAGRYLRT